ncbi:MAG: hypothetical protein JWM80_1778 [Cyanobacteria bacterium RYN_339]|nr:hypothetical protein [Cyanobacteria bacterium RYN_339]
MPFIFEKAAKAIMTKMVSRPVAEATVKETTRKAADVLGKDVLTLAAKKDVAEIFEKDGLRGNLEKAMREWSRRHQKAPTASEIEHFLAGGGGAKAEKVEGFVTPIVSYRPRNPALVPTKAEAEAIKKAMNANSRATLAALRTLPDGDRKAFRTVYDFMKDRPDGQRALQQLLIDGRLSWGTATDQKRNLIQALADLAGDKKLDSGILHRRTTLMAQLTQELADPVAVSQHYKGTCAATSRGQILWSMKNPTDYTDFVHDLARPEGKAKLPSGEIVERPHDWDAGNDKSPNALGLPGKPNKEGGRTISSQLTEPVFMQVGYGKQYRYSNTFDAAFSFQAPTNKMVMDGGLYGEQEARLLESIFPGKKYRVIYTSAKDLKESFGTVPKEVWQGERVVMHKDHQLNVITTTAAVDNPIPVGVNYELGGGHAVLVTGTHDLHVPGGKHGPARDETWVEYINPWGQREVMRDDAFKVVMDGLTTDGGVKGVVGG